MEPLISAFAFARGETLLRRRRNRTPSSQELAGWALERTGLDPVEAVRLLQRTPMPRLQRTDALRHLRPLVKGFAVTGQPLIVGPNAVPARNRR